MRPDIEAQKLAYIGPALLEAVGRAMGMEVIYALAEFTIPNMQMVFERAGFQIVGIIPASDRLLVAPGVTKRVYEAYYVKVLAADAEILRPQAESMTPRTKALYDFLFAGKGSNERSNATNPVSCLGSVNVRNRVRS